MPNPDLAVWSAAEIDADPESDARAVAARRAADPDRHARAAPFGPLFDAVEGNADEERSASARSRSGQPSAMELLVDTGAVAVLFERGQDRMSSRLNSSHSVDPR